MLHLKTFQHRNEDRLMELYAQLERGSRFRAKSASLGVNLQILRGSAEFELYDRERAWTNVVDLVAKGLASAGQLTEGRLSATEWSSSPGRPLYGIEETTTTRVFLLPVNAGHTKVMFWYSGDPANERHDSDLYLVREYADPVTATTSGLGVAPSDWFKPIDDVPFIYEDETAATAFYFQRSDLEHVAEEVGSGPFRGQVEVAGNKYTCIAALPQRVTAMYLIRFIAPPAEGSPITGRRGRDAVIGYPLAIWSH